VACPIPRSGKLGFVGDYTGAVLTRFTRVRNWVYNITANPELRVYSGTRFGTQRISGFVDSTGTFSGFGANPPLFAGDSFTFIGYTAPTSGVPCSPGCAFSVPAFVDSLNINWNFTQENRGVNWTINFSSDGDETDLPTFDDPCDDAVYCDDNVCDLVIEMRDCNDALVEFCNIISISLTFNANTLVYSNNSTSCRNKRQPGVLDWTMEMVDNNPCIIPVVNDDYRFDLMATLSPVTEWILRWGKMVGVSNLNVNMETGEIITKSNNFAMQAVNCCVPATPVRGSIIAPSGATVWPYSTPS